MRLCSCAVVLPLVSLQGVVDILASGVVAGLVALAVAPPLGIWAAKVRPQSRGRNVSGSVHEVKRRCARLFGRGDLQQRGEHTSIGALPRAIISEALKQRNYPSTVVSTMNECCGRSASRTPHAIRRH